MRTASKKGMDLDMWLSKRTAEMGESESLGLAVGIVSIGGESPSVIVEGETRNAQLICVSGVRLPTVGDEVLFFRDGNGENLVIGKVAEAAPDEVEDGEIYITTKGGGVIKIRKNGRIELEGNVVIKGRAQIDGNLLVNGTAQIEGQLLVNGEQVPLPPA